MSEWKKRKTSVHLIRIHDDKKGREKERKRKGKETRFTYSIGGATAIMSLSYTLIIVLLLLPGVFFSIEERKKERERGKEKLLWSTQWIESECSRARIDIAYGMLNCVKSCLGWWLLTSISLCLCARSCPLAEILIRQHLRNDKKRTSKRKTKVKTEYLKNIFVGTSTTKSDRHQN